VSPVPTVDAVQVPEKYPTALIYVDESAVKASAGRFFVVGAVKVRRPGQLMRAVRDIRDRHGFRDEFKFSKISRGKFPIFCELIDVLEQSDAHIAACVVDRSQGTAFGVSSFDDVRNDRVNVATLGERGPRTRKRNGESSARAS
jgi:hypothetical protein